MATIADQSLYVILTFIFGVFYAHAKMVSAGAGAIISFFLGRNWAFVSKEGKITNQAIRYIITALGSWLLNVKGLVFVTEQYGINHFYSNLIVATLVGIFYNFPLYRYFVYR